MSWANRNQAWAETLVDELARTGLTHAVHAPGSRSTPLVLALHHHPDLILHTILDERSAAFFALGLGKATGTPAAVVTTSGTAVANLHPAAVEATQSETPLLLLTADRPPRLTGADANQAIDQRHLFGPHAAFLEAPTPEVSSPALRHLRVLACRAVARARGPTAGAVHLNVPFEKPLEPTPVEGDVPDDFTDEHPLAARGRPDGAPFTRIDPAPRTAPVDLLDRLAQRIHESPRGVIVAGPVPDPHRVGPAVVALSRATGYPVVADPLSGARFAPGASEVAVAHADLWLRSPTLVDALAPSLVLRVGATPTSKHVARYLEHHRGAPTVVLDAGDRYKDHRAAATHVVQADPARACHALADAVAPPVADRDWVAHWHALDQATGAVLDEALAHHPFEPSVARALVARLNGGHRLLVSNSRPVRDLDGYAPARDEPLHVLGNRGASGIDGITSTAAGIAAATDGCVALVGDLALLHDAGGLQVVRDEQLPLVLVAVQNDGGGIFHQLPIRDHDPPFTQRFATPHGYDLSRLADLHEIPFTRTKGPGALTEALDQALARDGPSLVEVPTDRDETHRRHQEIDQAVYQATTDLHGGP